jgi:CBS domain-containing protein
MVALRVGDLMTRGVELVAAETTVQEAAVRMAEHDIGAVLVGSVERLEGVLTDRDVLLRLVVNGIDPAQVPVGDVMSTTVFTCLADASPDEALREMQERQVRRLPVVDERGCVVGIVVRSELLRALAELTREGFEDRSRPPSGAGKTH